MRLVCLETGRITMLVWLHCKNHASWAFIHNKYLHSKNRHSGVCVCAYKMQDSQFCVDPIHENPTVLIRIFLQNTSAPSGQTRNTKLLRRGGIPPSTTKTNCCRCCMLLRRGVCPPQGQNPTAAAAAGIRRPCVARYTACETYLP